MFKPGDLVELTGTGSLRGNYGHAIVVGMLIEVADLESADYPLSGGISSATKWLRILYSNDEIQSYYFPAYDRVLRKVC